MAVRFSNSYLQFQLKFLDACLLFWLLIGSLFLPSVIFAQEAQSIGIIPQPQSIIEKSGVFTWSPNTLIYSDPAFFKMAVLFAEQSFSAPENVKILSSPTKNTGIFFIKKTISNTTNPEAYKLIISSKQISIIAASAKGALNAMFTLLQLQLLQPDKSIIPCVEIVDEPRFSYRGLHLDVSRNFMPVEFIKKTISMMALYKLNTLHWHLTDGPGWRLQIKKYPQLTNKAAWRTDKTWQDWWNSSRQYTTEGASNAYGGYYTQEEAKSVVAYALARGITVIPEIEIPGHSEEVTAVYPNLACSGKPYTQSELCIGNDSTFIFLEEVLTEVMSIFPSAYIHVGGDEADKKAWLTCVKCQARIKKEHLKDVNELQSYAIKRLEKFLNAHGRKLLGWDEIIEGGLSAGATVMNWRSEASGVAAVKAGHDVIMTLGKYCYFDAYQAEPITQPLAIGGFLPLSKVYSYEPVPENLNNAEAKHILGGQACVWTEYMPTTEQVEYMIYPRLLAISEVLWSSKENKNWDGFQKRLQQQYRLLQRKAINYYRPIANLEINSAADTFKKANLVTIVSQQYKPDIRYTIDGTDPGLNSNHYVEPFLIKGMVMIKTAIVDTATKKLGPISSKQTAYHLGVGAKITYNQPYNNSYPAQGSYTLVNGQQGSYSYGDGQWQGFTNDFDITLELKEPLMIHKISMNFMQIIGPGVFMPEQVDYSWSQDGKTFSTPIRVNNIIADTETKMVIAPFATAVNSTVKFIRIKANNYKNGFLFTDEILIY